MPAVPSYLTQFSAPTAATLFDSTPSEYPGGLFDIPQPGSSGGIGLGLGNSAAGGVLKSAFGNGSLGGSVAGAVGGYLGSRLGTWGQGNAGSKIGGTLGGLAGSLLGPAGSFMGSAIGSALGGNFGPPPTVGPNFQGWLGRNPMGQLEIAGASGDNGLSGDDARGALSEPVNAVNAYLLKNKLSLGDLPKHFQVRAGENKMDPTIELGPYMAPLLNSNSLLKALIGKGYIQGDLAALGGPDPERIFSTGRWLEPEAIHPRWQSGIYELPDTGFRQVDPGRAAAPPEGMQYIGDNRNATPVDESLRALYAQNPSLFSSQPSLFG